MQPSTRTVVVLAVATITATLASAGIYGAIKSLPVREVEVARMFIVVAARDLPTGSRLAASDVKLMPWPSGGEVPSSFSDMTRVVNRGLVAPVSTNEPLTDAKLAPLEAGAGLPPAIPRGMRAMSVKVDEVIGVAGFVVPGTRVDVVATLRSYGPSAEAMSRTVVSNVLVLTAGTKFDQDQAKDGKAQPSSVVTLAVTPADAERIALASSEGRISLALRNPLDVAPTDTPGVRANALMSGSSPQPAPVRPVAAARPAVITAPLPAVAPLARSTYTVEVIRAASKSGEEVVR